jgi:hypothetical protein
VPCRLASVSVCVCVSVCWKGGGVELCAAAGGSFYLSMAPPASAPARTPVPVPVPVPVPASVPVPVPVLGVAATGGPPVDLAELDAAFIDHAQLGEILSLDEDDAHSFSREIVEKWFEQVEETLPKLQTA